uniref:Calmodulin n=1 Tax=Bicosoecida sp. CB-2014 TaxID=1486930 RepID=A0A7S1GAP5_9STRA
MDKYLTEAQKDGFKEIFHLFDFSGEGRIDSKELGTMLRALGQSPTEAEVQDIIAEVDVDGTGKLDFEEFLAMVAGRLKDTDIVGEVEASFDAFDVDGDGKVSAEDLRAYAEKLGEKLPMDDVREMVGEADLDGDGMISKDSFKRLMVT